MIGIIYMIKNPNNKIYIGQTTNFENRVKSYKYLKCINQPKIYNSIIKYGFINHHIEILEEIFDENVENLYNRLNDLETMYINLYDSTNDNGLNCKLGGLNSPHSDYTKDKIRKSKLGSKHSQETKDKLSLINTGRPSNRKGSKLSIEHIKKLVDVNTGRKSKYRKRVICNGIIYESISEASKVLNIPRTNINSVCTGKRNSAGGLKFNYYND